MNTETMSLIERLEELSAKATPGPWMGYSEPEVGLPYGLFAGRPMETGFLQMEPLTPLDIDLIVALRNNLPAFIEAAKALVPFANAAMGVEVFAPNFPIDGAVLRPSLDWYDSAPGAPLQRHSVRRSDLERARAAYATILTALREQSNVER